MRKLLFLFLLLATLQACTKYDDSGVQSRIDQLDERMATLEAQCHSMNMSISALQAILEAYEKQEGIAEVKELADGSGYSITFSSGRTVTLHNGENGKDGKTPVVSVRLDSDGAYYWTIDGSWLLDPNGKKIRAQGRDGADGVTPKLKIEDGWWYISNDGGKSWTKLYKATGEDGDSFFSSVTDNGKTVTIKLKDGTAFEIPKVNGELGISFSESEDIGIAEGETKEIEYTILNGSSDTRIKVFGQNGWTASVRKKDASHGVIVVSAPSPFVDGEIVVLVYEGDSKTVVRFLNFSFATGIISAPKLEYTFSGKDGLYEVSLNTNVEYSVSVPAEAAYWLSYTGLQTKALRQDKLVFRCSRNFGPEPRAAVVTIKAKASDIVVRISITQNVWDAVEIPDANLKAALVDKFDKDSDGEISQEEAKAVEEISVPGKKIKSVEGLHNFENLYYLDCSSNELSSIDLSRNPQLRILNVSRNSLSALDLSKVSLNTLICFDNDLSEIDLSAQNNLNSISCGDNPRLETLDMSNCGDSVQISALGCTSLAEIYLSKSQTILFKQIPSAARILYLTPDGTVTLMQRHTVGLGIKFIIMGDGYKRSSLAAESGSKSLFDTWAYHAMEAIFSEEPYKTFRDRFDVYSVAVESSTDSFNGDTAFGCTFGSGTRINGDHNKVFNYAGKVSGTVLSKTVVVVILNSTKYAGTCYYWSDHKAVAYVPTTGNDVSQFSQIMLHETGGHGFAKLLDEYYYTYTGTIPSDAITSLHQWYNWVEAGLNVDVTSDPSKVHWAHFLSDPRYSGQVGVYEGAMSYQYGVYRPTDNSIMRHNIGGYNAPSREAIYKRIMRLSEGYKWEYDYETFVAYDAINRSAASQACRRDEFLNFDEKTFIPLAPPVFVDE